MGTHEKSEVIMYDPRSANDTNEFGEWRNLERKKRKKAPPFRKNFCVCKVQSRTMIMNGIFLASVNSCEITTVFTPN